jgi:hypothetical protein
MKRAFVIAQNGHLQSELVPIGTPDVLRIGDRLTASRVLEAGYGAQIQPGEQGTVDHVDASTGFVEVLMDLLHRGLHEWHNHIWLEPFGTEDIIDGVVLTAAICLLEMVA